MRVFDGLGEASIIRERCSFHLPDVCVLCVSESDKNSDDSDEDENNTEEIETDDQLDDLISLVKRRKSTQRFT